MMRIAYFILLLLTLLQPVVLTQAEEPTAILSAAALAKLKTADPTTRTHAIQLLTTSLQTLKQADAALAKAEAQALQLPSRSGDLQLAAKSTALINDTAQKRWHLQQQISQVEAALTTLSPESVVDISSK